MLGATMRPPISMPKTQTKSNASHCAEPEQRVRERWRSWVESDYAQGDDQQQPREKERRPRRVVGCGVPGALRSAGSHGATVVQVGAPWGMRMVFYEL
jgi:hypothetical protein